ncbi:carboxypeptidase-like regulatory domain-containing protein [Sunxiuqinia sp. A32]|uniref:carboxypeptidase-like regulatory domain-containing protein n=1 Tax=Sunxiuqinia sp. A32 TaxID=3461496 RepID=UPI00404596D1
MKAILFIMLFVAFSSVVDAGIVEKKSSVDTEKVEMTSINGNILDEVTAEPLVGVKVVLEGTNKVAYTDFDGNYQLDNVKTGKYNLSASYVSYQAKSVKNVQVSLKSNQVNLKLETKN